MLDCVIVDKEVAVDVTRTVERIVSTLVGPCCVIVVVLGEVVVMSTVDTLDWTIVDKMVSRLVNTVVEMLDSTMVVGCT